MNTLLLLMLLISISVQFRLKVENQFTGSFSVKNIYSAISKEELTISSTNIPVVFMHGMGDAGSNAGMQSLCKSVTDKQPGTYSVCLNVANGMSSITNKLDTQVESFKKAVTSDPKLKDGFNAVGLSQGNLVVRGYIQKYNNPPVKNFISICGPHGGIGTCPNNILYKMVCPLWKLFKQNAGIAFSDYWKDVNNKADYLKKSPWLADMNNEKDQKNTDYKKNILSLKKFVLVMASDDTMVIPNVSEHFSFWKWGDNTVKVLLKDSEGYKGDWLGLMTLDKSSRLELLEYTGDHLRFSNDFWNNNILPFLAPSTNIEAI